MSSKKKLTDEEKELIKKCTALYKEFHKLSALRDKADSQEEKNGYEQKIKELYSGIVCFGQGVFNQSLEYIAQENCVKRILSINKEEFDGSVNVYDRISKLLSEHLEEIVFELMEDNPLRC